MNDAMYIGATGMQTQQLNVETIANNLVNATTTGYKKSVVSFTDLVTSDVSASGRARFSGRDDNLLSPAMRVGAGVGMAGITKQFDLGDFTKTGSSFDLAINGNGFFAVTMPDGSTGYTRGGTMKVNDDGMLATQDGYPLKPGIAIPDNAQSMTISADGHVQIVSSTDPSGTVNAGQLEMDRFVSPGQLTAQGNNLYKANQKAGEPISSDGIGAVEQGFLEGSNVKMVDEMVNLMIAQRAYESSVKVVQASDEMMGMVNQLHK